MEDSKSPSKTNAQSCEDGEVDTTLSETTLSSSIGSAEQFGTAQRKSRKKWKNDTQKVILESNTARGKAAIINSLFKIFLIPLCCAAVAHFMKVVTLNQLQSGFSSFFQDETLTLMFFIQIISSFIGYVLIFFPVFFVFVETIRKNEDSNTGEN